MRFKKLVQAGKSKPKKKVNYLNTVHPVGVALE